MFRVTTVPVKLVINLVKKSRSEHNVGIFAGVSENIPITHQAKQSKGN